MANPDKNTQVENPIITGAVAAAEKSAAALTEARKKNIEALKTTKKAATSTSTQSTTLYNPLEITTTLKTAASVTSGTATANADDDYKKYAGQLKEYDDAKAIAKAVYSHESISAWQYMRHRLFSGNQFSNYEKAYDHLQALKNKDKPDANAIKKAEQDLDTAAKTLVTAQQNLLVDKRKTKKEALNVLPPSDLKTVLERLELIDDVTFKLEQTHIADHEKAKTQIKEWHRKGEYKKEKPQFLNLAATPGHQELYDIRKEAKENAEKLQANLEKQENALLKAKVKLEQEKQKLPNPGFFKSLFASKSAVENVLKEAENHIDRQLSEIKSAIEASKKAVINDDLEVEKHLQQKYTEDLNAYYAARPMTEAVKEVDLLPTATGKQTAKTAGKLTIGGVSLATGAYVYGGLAALSFLAFPFNLIFLGAAPLGLFATYKLGSMARMGFNVEVLDKFGKENDKDGAHNTFMARISPNIYVSRSVSTDEEGNSRQGISSQYTGFFQTTAGRLKQVESFVESFIVAGLVKVPGGTFEMTSIPDDHYEEYCALLILVCKRYGIKLEGQALKKMHDPKEATKNKEAFATAQATFNTEEAKQMEVFKRLIPEVELNAMSKEEIEDKFRFYKLEQASKLLKRATDTPLLNSTMAIGDQSALNSQDNSNTPAFGVSGATKYPVVTGLNKSTAPTSTPNPNPNLNTGAQNTPIVPTI